MKRCFCCLAALLLVAVVSASAPNSMASAFPTHRCGSFVDEDDIEGEVFYARIAVYNGNHLSCRLAMQVIEAFWGPEGGVQSHGGPSEVQTYYTLRGFPGWRCYTGAGAGSCIRRGKIAAYRTLA